MNSEKTSIKDGDSGSATALSRVVMPAMPGIAAGATLGLSDVLAKIALAAGSDVVTTLACRGLVGLAVMTAWLRLGPKPPHADARARWISAASGVMFAGVIFCLFKAINAIDVPTAILSYFSYPLLTGLTASLAGLERLRWQGALCAIAAFLGLAVMIGAHPAGLALAGVGYALGAACCRTGVFLITRGFLVGVDARLSTWYLTLSSTALFVAAALVMQTWHFPQTDWGWVAFVGLGFATTSGVLFLFVSTVRIGAFRTALIMNLEPLTATVLSALLLGEMMTPVQGIGTAIMLAALVAFQIWR